MINPRIIGIVVLLGWLTSCQKDLDIEIVQEEPRLAVYSMLQPDSLVSVWVSHSKSVTDSRRIKAITKAEVTISSSQGLVRQLILVDTIRGKYQADFTPQAGATYHLSVTAEGYSPIEATTTIPIAVSLDHVSHKIIPANKVSEYGHFEDNADTVTRYAFALTFSDPPSEENYYMVSSALEYWGTNSYRPSEGADWITVWDTLETIAHNESVDPALQDLENLTVGEPYQGYRDYYFTDQIFNWQEYTFDYTSEVDEAFPLNMVIILTSYHEDAYRYIQTSRQQDFFDALFFEMVPLAQNIQGGYGIFSSLNKETVVVRLNE